MGLSEVLIKENLITPKQLQEAKEKQRGAKKPIHELFVEMGFITEEVLVNILSRIYKMPISNLKKESIDPSVTKLISYIMAKRYGVFPVRKEGDSLLLAMSDPTDIIALDDIRAIVNMRITPILSMKSDISNSIEKYYQSDDSIYDLLKNFPEDAKIETISTDKKFGKDTLEMFKDEQSPVPRLINIIINDAIKARASDIHIEPQQDLVRVRYRVDGDLREVAKIPNQLHHAVLSRIKVMAEMNIAETKKLQDGRIAIVAQGRNIDLRISVIPSHFGEKVVLRVLDPKEAKVEIDKIGFIETELNLFKEACNQPNGMILVTGPTGSGKTSTIYAALNLIKSRTQNIITIEDPIEYLIEGITQMQINPVKEVTFITGLRSILRQDPNVMFIGEIRDRETADIAFRAAMTGHLVFSTLHTNNSVASITRLLDLGMEPYLISSSITLIIAQRLVRIICPNCKGKYVPAGDILDKFGFILDKYGKVEYYKGAGCEKCSYTGFLGRTAIFEILRNNKQITRLIFNKASEEDIFKEAKKGGLKSLAESGIEKVASGITTIEEIHRVVSIVEETVSEEREERREKFKILVVDDDNLIRKMVVAAFNQEKDNYEFIEAENGREAIKLVYDIKPNLLIVDVVMPELDGYEVVKHLRSHLETASLPIIMLTARSDKASEIKGLDIGADDYITKPFDKDRLLARAKMLLRKEAKEVN